MLATRLVLTAGPPLLILTKWMPELEVRPLRLLRKRSLMLRTDIKYWS